MFDMSGPKIGIIGLGFVGEAIRDSYESVATRICIDTDIHKGYVGTYKEIMDAEGIFVCVPSPSKPDGSCDSSILESVLINLKDYRGVIISKVTATPDIYERLQEEYENLVYVPEFLTSANAYRDYQHQKWAIIGGKIHAYQREAERIIRYSKPELQAFFSSIGEASLHKYIVNSFLATKVTFMNEMYELAEKKGYNWDHFRRMMMFDPRLGSSHTSVPGPDGSFGFGGMCFPKDTSALLKYAESINCDLNILSNAVKKNTLMRLKKPK